MQPKIRLRQSRKQAATDRRENHGFETFLLLEGKSEPPTHNRRQSL